MENMGVLTVGVAKVGLLGAIDSLVGISPTRICFHGKAHPGQWMSGRAPAGVAE